MERLGLAEKVCDLLEKYGVGPVQEIHERARVLKLHDKPVVNPAHFRDVDLMYSTHKTDYEGALVNMLAFCACVEYGNTGLRGDEELVFRAKDDLKEIIGVNEGELAYNFFNVRDSLLMNAKRRGVSTKDYLRDMFYYIE